ncbi:MAG: hypothetical protein AB7P52_11605 [Alphaproteobacteria bacterium]
MRLQQALSDASEALKRIDRHEADCVEFRREIKVALERLANRWWSAALGLIAVLLTTLGYLLARTLLPMP